MLTRKLIIIIGLLLTCVIASLAWIGWLTDTMILTSFFDRYIPMAPLTATCFLLLCASLWLNYFKKKNHFIIYVTVALFFLITLNVFLTVFHAPYFKIEESLVKTRNMFGLVPMGRMSPITASLFFLNGIVLFLFTKAGNYYRNLAGVITTIIFLITLTVLIGYLYNSPILYGETTIPIAFTTTLGFVFITTVLFLINGVYFFPLNLITGDTTQAILLRVFIPFTAVLIIASGAFQIYLRNRIFNNEALIISIVAISAVIAITLVTIYLSQLISKKIDTIELEKKRLGSILEVSSDWVIIYTDNGKLLDLNNAVKKHASLPEEKMVNEVLIEEIFPGWHTQLTEGILQAKTIGVWGGEAKLKLKTGKSVNFSILLLYHTSSQGGFMSAVMRDIQELKQYQEHIELINDQLKLKNQEMEQFVYAISHDMREPVRMISSFVGLIKMKLKNQTDDETQKYLDFAVSGAQRLDLMIKDLLEYSQFGKTQQELSRCDLAKSIHDAVTSLQPVIRETKAIINIMPAFPTVSGYCNDLTRLFQNLIGNALKYRSERDPVIDVFFTANDTFFTIGIRDNGMGIDKNYFNEIFKMFKRISPANYTNGSGIGLASCKKIVEVHGGKIWVESTLREGSTFFFTLPKPVG